MQFEIPFGELILNGEAVGRRRYQEGSFAGVERGLEETSDSFGKSRIGVIKLHAVLRRALSIKRRRVSL